MSNNIEAIIGHSGAPLICEYCDFGATKNRPARRFLFGNDMVPLIEHFTAACNLIRDTPRGEVPVEFKYRGKHYSTASPLPPDVHYYDEVHETLQEYLNEVYMERCRKLYGFYTPRVTLLNREELARVCRSMILSYPHNHCSPELYVVQGFTMIRIIDQLPLEAIDRNKLRALTVVLWVNRAVGLYVRHATARFNKHSGGLGSFELEHVLPMVVNLQLMTAAQEAMASSNRLNLWVDALNKVLTSMGLGDVFRTATL